MKKNEKRYAALLLSFAILGSLLFGEMVLRLLAPNRHYVWPPNLEMTFKPDPEIMPGISGDARFLINDAGIRGRPFSDTDRYRILALGGSTTECAYLDQSEAWPHLLQEILNQEFDRSPVWVGNVGKSSMTSRHHTLQIGTLLDEYPPIDLVVILIGGNDMLLRLARDTEYRPLAEKSLEQRQELSNQAFWVNPGWDTAYPFYKRTEIWRMVRKAKEHLLGPLEESLLQDTMGANFVRWRKHRKSAVNIRNTLPGLSVALNEYVQNLDVMIDMALERNTQIVLVTQPDMWRNDLPPELEDLLWFGGIGRYQAEPGKEYYSVSALAEAMEMYNETLLQVCRERGIPCVDLASALPKDGTVFIDDLHFNESGAAQVADVVAQQLIEAGVIALQ